MEKSIKVNILNRDYPLKVKGEEEESSTREIAEYVNDKMTGIQQGLGSVPELTCAIIGALSLGEELFELKRQLNDYKEKEAQTAAEEVSEEVEASLRELTSNLKSALG